MINPSYITRPYGFRSPPSTPPPPPLPPNSCQCTNYHHQIMNHKTNNQSPFYNVQFV
ncbi:hypothetical protein DERF_008372 [Dermatophagoides farinae]|uniref:Uncharacterized protein n=1 Tax=Dermatophagoides farinae TaxID=6954 RepID=A0A922I5I8_DERFA|nr:hypothetical protein DERF_008372 [Dermatophagoides farinae]